MTVTLYKNVGDNEAVAILRKTLKEGIVSQNVKILTSVALDRFGHIDSLNSVWKFVKENFPYQSDPEDYELFIHPNRVALDYFNGIPRSGDCDDHALLTAAMLGAIGYRTKIILADCNFDGEIDHAFSQVHSEKLGWLNFDTSGVNPLGWIIPYGKGITVDPN